MKKDILKVIISAILLIIAEFAKINNEWIKIILFIISYLLVGAEVIVKAIKKMLKKDFFDENFLMTVATIGAIAIKQFPEAISVMLFYEIGEILQDTAVEKSKKSITSLLKIRPDYANIKDENEKMIKVKPEEIKTGQTIFIKPGEKIPIDGIVIEGKSSIDTSALTGESIPREIKVGDEALSGCINLDGMLTVEVSKEFKQSTVNKIIDLVENATEKKTTTENFITKFSKIYTPVVVLLAIVIAIFSPFILKTGEFNTWLYKALTFLVISCPCALVISVPLSFFSGIGGASRKGILVKGSNYLEVLSNVKTVIFDKTGTLTKGKFEVQEIKPKDITRDDLIKIAAYAENHSNHPIAKSVRKLYKGEVEEKNISSIKEISGKGIICTLYNLQYDSDRLKHKKETSVIIGNKSLLVENNIENIEEKDNDIGTILYIAINDIYSGKIIIADEIKKDSKESIKQLKKIGVNDIVMITGDKEEVAKNVSKKLGIETFHFELLPDEKMKKMEELLTRNFKSDRGKVAFVGDGINDAPSLARADVGIAMGGLGSDAAIEAASVVIMNDEPSKIPLAIEIAKKTMKISKENIWFAIIVKTLILIMSILGITTMWQAVFADVGVTIIAVFNSLRALK